MALVFAGYLPLVPAISWSQHEHHRGPSPTPTIGGPAIPFELTSLAGERLSLTGFRGKPLVVNFFASWCDPCREEMPLINSLAAGGEKKGYAVLGIAVEDSRAALTAYAKELNLRFPIALDLNSAVRRAYRIFGPPATFFIDSRGIIRDVVLGPLTPRRAAEAMERLGIGVEMK
ncbi:MAG TPA: TlpA disulfide reductase family protein [Candidatus Eisenbacteria bacterium]|nr:TlpA disulfide reductase family protein [Candidatus Eisenbacteria bacterium]